MNRIMQDDQELTVYEVAKRLRRKYYSTRNLIASGKIRARKEGKDWRVSEADLQAYIRSTYRDSGRDDSR